MEEKKKKLFVVVLGEQNSGKSRTWMRLFHSDNPLRTRSLERELKLNDYLNVNVFLFYGSFQERDRTFQEFKDEFKKKCLDNDVQIVLCSLQTHSSGDIVTTREILDFVCTNGFDIYIQWLYPGSRSSDEERNFTDTIERDIIDLMRVNSVIGISNVNARQVLDQDRAERLRTIILGWILSR